MHQQTCPVCNGTRLKNESLYFKIGDKNITELSELDITELTEGIAQYPQYLNERRQKMESVFYLYLRRL